jgi:hypothetical protein
VSRPGVRRSSGTARLLVGLGLLLAGLLAIVALASSGDLPGSSPAGDRPGIPNAVFSYLYASFLLAALASLPLLLYLYVRERDEAPERRRRRRQLLPIAFVAVVGAIFLIASHWPEGFADLVDRIRIGGEDGPAAAARRAPRPPGVEWVPLAVVSSVVATMLAAFVGWRVLRRRGGTLSQRELLAAALSETLDGTLDDLRAEPDARRAIIRTYARMEATLESCGVPRHGSEAPLEYVERVLLALDVSPGPVHALTDLFEQAKFSDHALDGAMKVAAIDALEAIRTELRALA